MSRARAGDETAFARLVGPLQPELRAHCYRMLGSVHDADDALQDVLVRAWRGLGGFERRSSLRTWLYTVATRVCLDALAHRGRRVLPVDLGPAADHPVVDDVAAADVPWLTPFPGPDGTSEQREAVRLAFVAACQHLPGNQRAALLLFDVLGFTAAEIATMMDTTVASVNSALQRARARTPLPAARPADDARLRRTVEGFAGALERGDADAFVALVTADVTWSMPPLAHWYAGRDAVRAFAAAVPMARCGSWRHEPRWANGAPAVASYLADTPSGEYRPWSVNVFDFEGDRIAAITSFLGEEYFALV